GTPPYTYQWLVSANGGASYSALGSPQAGGTPSYVYTPAAGTWWYELNVTDSASVNVTVTSSAINLTINPTLVAPLVASSINVVDQGQFSLLSNSTPITTGTVPYSYQWYQEAPGNLTYFAINGAAAWSYTFASTTGTILGTWNFQLNITDAAGVPVTVTSIPCSITVNSALAAPTPFANFTVLDAGQYVNLSASITSTGTGPYSYQWLASNNGGITYAALGSPQCSPDFVYAPAASTWWYKLNVTDSAGTPTSAISTTVAIIVNYLLEVPLLESSPSTISQNQASILSNSSGIVTGTAPYFYQWFVQVPGSSYAIIDGATSSSYIFATNPSNVTGDWYFVLQVTDSANVPVTSNSSPVVVVLRTVAQLVVSITVSNYSIDQGQFSYFTNSTSGGLFPYSYQWFERSGLGGPYSNITGATGPYYTFTTTTSTPTGSWYFILQVTDTLLNSTNSTPVMVMLNAPPVAPTITANFGTIDLGQSTILYNTTFVVNGTPNYTYQWLNSTNIGGPFSPISGATLLAYNFVPWTTGTWYFELNVTDAAGVPVTVTSGIVTIGVNSGLVVFAPTANFTTLDFGQDVYLFSSPVTSGTPSYAYQWLESSNAGVSYAALGTPQASPSYVFAPSVGTWNFKLSVTDSAGAPVTVTSVTAITIIVNNMLVVPMLTVTPSTRVVDQGQVATITNNSQFLTGTAPYSYQWAIEGPGQATFSNITGATSWSFTFATTPSIVPGIWQFNLEVTDSAGVCVTATSTAVMVTVNAALVSPTVGTSSATLVQGQSAMLSNSTPMLAGTSPYTFQWVEESPGASSYSATGGNSPSFSFYTSTSNTPGMWSFILDVTDSAGMTVSSSPVTVALFIGTKVRALTSLAQTKSQRDSAIFTFAVSDLGGVPFPPDLTTAGVSFTSSSTFNPRFFSWANDSQHGLFNLVVDTTAIPAGTYTLRVLFQRTDYLPISEDLTLEVDAYQPLIAVPAGVQIINGSTATITFTVTDGLFGASFSAIKIDWSVAGTGLIGSILQINASGQYSFSFLVLGLPDGKNFNVTIHAQVTINGVSYATITDSVVAIQVEYPQILGIPALYFWILVVGLAAGVGGIFLAYRIKTIRRRSPQREKPAQSPQRRNFTGHSQVTVPTMSSTEKRAEPIEADQATTPLKEFEEKLKELQAQNDVVGMAECYGNIAKYYEDAGDKKKTAQYRLFEEINRKEIKEMKVQNASTSSVLAPKPAVMPPEGLVEQSENDEIDNTTTDWQAATIVTPSSSITTKSVPSEETCPSCFGLMKDGVCELCGAKKCQVCATVNDSGASTCRNCNSSL
ncbi:MAG TPA: hypothetical protein VKK79_13895, partial [Candidatus Lokiarchaeia archaeon]|nr:hypothetical protein [Candidatus Lokiarchaeia archaeon]